MSTHPDRSASPRYVALIPAAGSGSRMELATPKQYAPLAGRPLIEHAVRVLCAHPRIAEVFVVLAPGDAQFAACDWRGCEAKLSPLYCGGETRAASVFNGLLAANDAIDGNDWVLVHDAARPCLSAQDIDRLIADVGDNAVGGLLAVPVADTLKRANAAQESVQTEGRDHLWRAQTPQMFRYRVLIEALRRADVAAVTDESSAVEQTGARPLLVRGSATNFKVTYPEDLALAELILGAAGEVMMRIGQGFDVHALVEGRPLIIGGVSIPFDRGLAGHSDADVLLHALCDALIGAAGLGDIGKHFPDTDPRYKGIDSRELLRAVVRLLQERNFSVINVDSTIIAQAPKMAPYIPAMRANIAADLGLHADDVNIKAKTAEKLGFVGRGEGIVAEAVVLIRRLVSTPFSGADD